MAKFFISCSKKTVPIDIHEVVSFYSSSAMSEIIFKRINSIDNSVQGVILQKKHEQDSYFIKGDINVIIDGTPLLNNKKITAADMYQFFVSDSLERTCTELNGGYSAVIIDITQRKCIAIRDRIGLKPLYYYTDNDTFSIASNAGALKRSKVAPIQTNLNMIAKYASSNFRAIYGREETFFKEITLVQPSEVITFEHETVSKKTYWDWDPSAPYLTASETDLSYMYVEHIENSVKNYLDALGSDKVAIALSGGVDSGTMIGMMHKILQKRIHAGSLSYNESTDFDESHLITCSVRDHAESWANIKADINYIKEDIPSLYHRFDLPLATISIYGYDYLYRSLSQQGYSTIFTGAGGDYLQAGNYPCFLYNLADYYYNQSDQYAHELECWIKNHSTSTYPKNEETIKKFFNTHIDFNKKGSIKAAELLLTNTHVFDEAFLQKAGSLAGSTVKSYGDYLRTYIVQELRFEAVAPGTEAEDLIDWFYDTSMTSPFFSKELIDLGWRIPSSYKIKNGINKVLARKAVRGICADEILDRIDKSGFNAPFDIWIRNEMREFVFDIFSSQKFRERGIYNYNIFMEHLNEHMSQKRSHMMFLWQALNLELWLRSWE